MTLFFDIRLILGFYIKRWFRFTKVNALVSRKIILTEIVLGWETTWELQVLLAKTKAGLCCESL